MFQENEAWETRIDDDRLDELEVNRRWGDLGNSVEKLGERRWVVWSDLLEEPLDVGGRYLGLFSRMHQTSFYKYNNGTE